MFDILFACANLRKLTHLYLDLISSRDDHRIVSNIIQNMSGSQTFHSLCKAGDDRIIIFRTRNQHIRQHIHKIRVESRALLISGPPSRVRKGRSCKVEILICAWNAREKFVIHEANISKTNPVTLLF